MNAKRKAWVEQVLEGLESVKFTSFKIGCGFHPEERRVIAAIDYPGREVAFAICHPDDHYDRSLGKAVAVVRLGTKAAFKFAEKSPLFTKLVGSADHLSWDVCSEKYGSYQYINRLGFREVLQVLASLQLAGWRGGDPYVYLDDLQQAAVEIA